MCVHVLVFRCIDLVMFTVARCLLAIALCPVILHIEQTNWIWKYFIRKREIFYVNLTHNATSQMLGDCENGWLQRDDPHMLSQGSLAAHV